LTKITEEEILIPLTEDTDNLIEYFKTSIEHRFPNRQTPIRFAVSKTDSKGYHAEIGMLKSDRPHNLQSIFDFTKRQHTSSETFNAALIIPTGIGAEIGGHAGDAGAIARLIAAACDNLITHPNVVNASDINELPDNGLYVEGSVLSRLIAGSCGLRKTRANKLLIIMDYIDDNLVRAPVINAVSAARASLGVDIAQIIQLKPSIKTSAEFTASGSAVGRIEELQLLTDALDTCTTPFDAIALATTIKLPEKETHQLYLAAKGDLVNPWGGAEAMLTHYISMKYNLPSAHAPMMETSESLKTITDIVDPRMAAEEISSAFIHCILKGLAKAPQIVNNPQHFNHAGVISAKDIDCLIIPDHCLGIPVMAAIKQGIPIIAIRENTNRMQNDLNNIFKNKIIYAENYPEAVGIMTALKAGIALETIKRPLIPTTVIIKENIKAHNK
jgi:hypothetical protein